MPAKPSRLRDGDTIGIVAPASAPPDPASIDGAVTVLENLGFKVRLGTHVRRRWGFLAGTDQERAADLMAMFLDPQVRAILCVRGGYGTARLLPLLDFQTIRAHPKILVGYSDLTSLHSALLKKALLVSFHGPMLNSDFIKADLPEFTLASFRRTLMHPEAPGSICRGYPDSTVEVLQGGRAVGRLVGGNLSILCASLGTPYQPSLRRAILFLEDVDEVPYRFDRMLTQLLNAGVLQEVAGVAVGINHNCQDPKAKLTTEYRQTVEDVLRERLAPLRVPIVAGLPFGHVAFNATLPVGLRVTLDGDRGDLLVEEPAVR
jgi:muramoyltetrapeptide carboxypeptidase